MDLNTLRRRLSDEREPASTFGPNPTKADIQAVVTQYKAEGLCGRRVAEQRLGPYFLASDKHGQREINLLDEVVEEVYADTDLCIRSRSSECSRFRGGCKGSR